MDAAQAEDVWVNTEEAAGRTWVMARLDGDHACGVRTEVDAADREANTARAGPATVGGVEDGAENRTGIMGDVEIAIDRSEYVKNNIYE